MELINTICGKYKTGANLSRKEMRKKKPEFLMPFLEYTSENLIKYHKAAQPDWRIKDAFIFALGNLAEFMYDYPDLRSQLEPMFQQYIT